MRLESEVFRDGAGLLGRPLSVGSEPPCLLQQNNHKSSLKKLFCEIVYTKSNPRILSLGCNRMQAVMVLSEFEEESRCLLLRSHLSLSRMNKTSSPNPPGVQVSKV